MDLRTFQCWQRLTAYLGLQQKVGSTPKATRLPQPTRLLPISNEKPLHADAVERSGEQDKSETRQEGLGLEHSTVEQEMSQILLSGLNTPHMKKDMISIDNLTALLRDSGLNLTASVDQVYCPKNQPSLVDIMLIDGAETVISPDADTPTMYQEELRDVLQKSLSKVRLITCTSNIDMKDSFRETASEQSLLDSGPSVSKFDSSATYRAYDQTDTSYSQYSCQEYIRFISDHVSNTATTDINSERPLTVVYHSKGIGAVVKRAMIGLIKPSEVSQLPASYSLRWLDPDWRTIESIISDLRITNNLMPCSLDSVQVKESAELQCPGVCSSDLLSSGSHLISHPLLEIELPKRRAAAHLDGIATGQPTLDRHEPSIQIDKAVAHARRRNRNMFIVVFEKPVDAVKSLWLDLSLFDRIQE
jgi:hypothetical protein